MIKGRWRLRALVVFAALAVLAVGAAAPALASPAGEADAALAYVDASAYVTLYETDWQHGVDPRGRGRRVARLGQFDFGRFGR